jgi:hypothetical protein
MGRIIDAIKNLGEKSKEKRALVNQMSEQLRMEKIAQDRMKPNSQRLIERYQEELNEKERKVLLEHLEKERDNDFKFGHNPLQAKMVVGKTEWEVLKERNMFSNSKATILKQKNIFKNNKRCY